MKKNRVLVWLVVGAVAVVGLCYVALATRASPDAERYEADRLFQPEVVKPASIVALVAVASVASQVLELVR